MVEGLVPEAGPAVKCSFCGKTYLDEDKHNMGFETDEWGICFCCFRKVCDKGMTM